MDTSRSSGERHKPPGCRGSPCHRKVRHRMVVETRFDGVSRKLAAVATNCLSRRQTTSQWVDDPRRSPGCTRTGSGSAWSLKCGDVSLNSATGTCVMPGNLRRHTEGRVHRLGRPTPMEGTLILPPEFGAVHALRMSTVQRPVPSPRQSWRSYRAALHCRSGKRDIVHD